ncbi:hypothetical protein [Pseudomonas putida]|uniref:hypothetical protein n=1 Tax=Pseudomonas putida TaxID=303 RepID=UPI000F3AD0BF|nr:hypothetical protein [Pseudomonas putida]RNF71082.1 hypothetical protein EFJ98_11155 [Pseudomonas putida]UZM92640.1 hypothetical protein OPZ46_22700 [Pseudomonas putida DOT-T1E]
MDFKQVKKEGLLTITASLVLIVIALILSDGYNPRGGLLWSITHKMHLFKIAIGCEPQAAWGAVQTCEDGFAMAMQTKYVVSALGILLVYGVGQYLEFFPSLRLWGRSQRGK